MTRSGDALDDLADLEEQRDFLLRSLDDLDAELAAGDIDDDEYAVLRDDYTRRAAEVIKAVDEGRRALPEASDASRKRNLMIVAAILAFGVIGGLVISQSFGQRRPGETSTGSVNQSLRTQVAIAEQARAAGDRAEARRMVDDVLAQDGLVVDAIVLSGHLYIDDNEILLGLQEYDRALELEPDNVDALAWRGWTMLNLNDPELFPAGIGYLDRAVALDPNSFEPFVFRGFAARQLEQDFPLAIEMYERAIELGAPPVMAGQLGERIDEMRAALDG